MDFVNSSLLSESVHLLSKSGMLPQHDQWRCLSLQQKVELYEYFRDHCERWESEWRSSFCGLVGIGEEDLPAISNADEWGDELFRLIDSGCLEAVRKFIKSVCPDPVAFDPGEAYSEGRNHVEGMEPEFVPFDYYPIQATNDDCEYAIPYAERLGQTEIAFFLRSTLETIQEAWKTAFREGYREVMNRRKTFDVTIQTDGSLSHQGNVADLDDLVAQAKMDGSNYLLIRAPHGEGFEVVNPIWLAFNSAGVIGTFDSYEVERGSGGE